MQLFPELYFIPHKYGRQGLYAEIIRIKWPLLVHRTAAEAAVAGVYSTHPFSERIYHRFIMFHDVL